MDRDLATFCIVILIAAALVIGAVICWTKDMRALRNIRTRQPRGFDVLQDRSPPG